MQTLDPTSTGLVSALFAVGLAVVLWISRIGMGEVARGVRLWLLGDAVIIVSRYVTTAASNAALWQPPLPPLVLNNGLIVAGAALHWMALRRHLGRSASPARDVGLCGALGMAVGVATSLADAPWQRGSVLHVAMIVLFLLQLRTTLPAARRFSGARVLGVAFAWGLLANAGMLAGSFEHATNVAQRSAAYLLMGATMSLITGAAFLLWLQQELRQQFVELAVTDALTGLLNRHGLLARFDAELSRARRSGRPLSVALCDLDHFKRVNDTHGHAVGDRVIRHFADSLRGQLRKHDLVGRWGGEEFLVILPDTPAADAVEILERLRQAQTPAGAGLPLVTLSAGIAAIPGDAQGGDAARLLQCADERLYRAKKTRDAVVGPQPSGDGPAWRERREPARPAHEPSTSRSQGEFAPQSAAP